MSEKTKVKLGIYMTAILMMGAIGVSSSLSAIGANFPQYDQTVIQNLVSIPCLVVIPTTLIAGKLMDFIAKKSLVIVGIVLFVAGGVGPVLFDGFAQILVCRGIFGIGIGLLQVLCSALVAEHFAGAERERVQGNMTSAQMLGCAFMAFVGGWLGSLGWNTVFYIHLVGIVSLVGAIVLLPANKPVRGTGQSEPKETVRITSAAWGWIALMFLFFIGGQIYTNSVSFLVTELNIGTAAEAGTSLAFFAIGGFVMGLIFGKTSSILKKATISIGFLALAASYLIIVLSSSIPVIYLGSFLCGLAFSIAMPCIFVGAGGAVNAASTGMAIALATCAQNFGMFLCPYVVNPICGALTADNGLTANQMAVILGGGFLGVIGGVSLIAALFGRKPKLAESDEPRPV